MWWAVVFSFFVAIITGIYNSLVYLNTRMNEA
jgi:hypothetical protein